jgi:spore germination cell wall hydrolase CwlJ-like protein
MKALSRIIRLAQIVSSGIIVKALDKATHYHASYVSPGWASNKQFKFITQVGKHIFYVDLQ